MKIGLQTWGVNGDIRPLIALANGLQQAGHTVTFVVTSIDNHRYEELCQPLGIRYLQVPAHVDFDMQAFSRRTSGKYLPHWLGALLDETFFPYEQELYRTALQLAQDNDCVIGHHLLYPLKLAAKQHRKPFFSVTFCPAGFPVPGQPPFRFPDYGERWYGLEWKLFHRFFNWMLKRKMTRLWLAEGQRPIKNVFTDLLISEQLNLIPVDPLFCPDQRLWPPANRVCGFLGLNEEAETWPMPPTLKRFLAEGDAPVYMTFGSMQQSLPDWSMELFIGTARSTGCRAIIQTSDDRYPPDSRQEDIYFIGKHPHPPVFEQCKAIIHHGGAGITHTATYCGCPSVVVPFMDEQLYWAKQLKKLGVAGRPLALKAATIELLAERLRGALGSSQLRQRAENLSKQMKNRQSIHDAVRLIESQMP